MGTETPFKSILTLESLNIKIIKTPHGDGNWALFNFQFTARLIKIIKTPHGDGNLYFFPILPNTL